MSLLSSWLYPLTTGTPALGTEVIANLDMIADKIGRVSGAGLLDNDNINPVPGKELEQAKISGLVAALAAKMPLAGGIFTGNVDLNYATPQLRIMQSGVDKVRLTSAGIFADTVSENTAGTGVTVDGVLVKDGGVGLTATGHLSAGALTAGVKHELKDSGMTESTLLRLAADDADPWALVVGNDTYSSIATDGLAFQVKNTGQVVLRVKGTGADLVLGTDVEPSAVKLGANGSLALVRAYITANGNNIGLYDPASPSPEDVVFIGKHSENYIVSMFDASSGQYKLAFVANPAGEVGIGTYPVAGVGMKVAGTTVTTGTVNARNMVADGAKLDTAHQGENHTGDVTSAGLVTTIATGAVTVNKIATGAVTQGKIAANAVIEGKIAPLAVTEGNIATGAVTEAKLAAGAVTEAKLGVGSVTATIIGASAVVAGKIAGNAVTNTTIEAGAVSNSKLTTVPTATFKGRTTAGTGAPEDLTIAQAKALLGITAIGQVACMTTTVSQAFGGLQKIAYSTVAVSNHGIVADPTGENFIISTAGVYQIDVSFGVRVAFANASIVLYVDGFSTQQSYVLMDFPVGTVHLHFTMELLANAVVDVRIDGTGTIDEAHTTIFGIA